MISKNRGFTSHVVYDEFNVTRQIPPEKCDSILIIGSPNEQKLCDESGFHMLGELESDFPESVSVV